MAILDHAINKISTLLGIGTTTASNTLSAILDSRESERIFQVSRYWKLYNGQHYDYTREDGEMPFVNFSYGQVEKSAAWLVEKPPILRGRKDLQPLIAQLTDEIIENSGGDIMYYEAAQMGGVSGDCLLQLGYDPDVNYQNGGVVIRVLDSERTFWEYQNIGQRRVLHRVMIIWDELDDKGEVKTYSEVWSKDEVRVYPPGKINSVRNNPGYDPATVDNPLITDNDGREFAIHPNPYGELPFVHIPNLLISQNVHGRSDLHDNWVINKEMDESLVSYKDNVEYHGNPITLLFGLSAKEVEKGANKIWGNLPTDARVENLQVTQTYEQIKDYMKMLEKYAGLSGIPFHLLNLEQQPSSDTSAAALRMAYLPLVELTARKRKTYGRGFKEAMEKAIRFQNEFFQLGLETLTAPDEAVAEKLAGIAGINDAMIGKVLALRTKPYYTIDIEFQEHLPKNRALELADLEVEMRLKLESLKNAMLRMGISDPEAKMEEILNDQDILGMMNKTFDEAAGYDEEGTGEPPSQAGDGFVDDKAGGRGRKSRPASPVIIEEKTGQSADRTAVQRTARGKGDN